MDINETCLNVLTDLMIAQATECVYEKANQGLFSTLTQYVTAKIK